VHFFGDLDEVRLWSAVRSPAQIRASAVFDTVPGTSPGLLGYWPFNEPVQRRACASRLVRVYDQVTGAGAALRHGATVVLSDAPIDRPPSLNVALLPARGAAAAAAAAGNIAAAAAAAVAAAAANNASAAAGRSLADGSWVRVLVGDELWLAAAAADQNPSDTVRLKLEAPSNYRAHPTGLTVTGDGSGQALVVQWAPGAADGGKEVQLCFAISGVADNPAAAALRRPQPALRLCVMVSVPACAYRAARGDTLRAVALRYGVPWRTLFGLNPAVPGPDALVDGAEIAVGRRYTLHAGERVEDLPALFGVGWAALATHNTPALLRLAAPPPVDCDAARLSCRPSEAAAAAAAGRVLAGRLVVDVNYTDLGQTVPYGAGAGTELCIVGRIYDGCL
jgi:hypothetical protein